MEVVWLLMLLPGLVNPLGTVATRDVTLHITRQNNGDIFNPEGVTRGCKTETCVGLSSGTAQAASGSDHCQCQCHPHLPAFREDLRICVDDIHECVLSPFGGGSTSQQIPFVFLPLKGQIIHPSKEISFTGIVTPVCAVSGAKFLTEAGWVDLRNPLDTDIPFRLFRDEGRTFLQWVGEPDLRTKMSGRVVLVYLMCREISQPEITEENALFSPCVAFRIVGSPSKYLNNVSEVAFSLDAHDSSDGSEHLSVSEYVAIGICSVLLGLIYVASVFLYLHLRKRNRDSTHKTDDENLGGGGGGEEGIVKNNPLLGMPTHFVSSDNVFTDSGSSDTDIAPDIVQHHDEIRKKSSRVTSAMVHSQYKRNFNYSSLGSVESILQDTSSIEKLPEENVSIVETLEGREEGLDGLKAISGTVRRKLYFNPAYFEPQLLLAPPPAALEFLSKIREVITIAKQKMSSKRFAPSLIVIPEEDSNYAVDPSYDFFLPTISRRSSMVSLKRENSRRKNCSGCPGCELQDFRQLCGNLPEFPSCKSCNATAGDIKQRSIRKWLEDVPVLKQTENNIDDAKTQRNFKRVRSPTKSLPPEEISTPIRALSPRPASERGQSPERRSHTSAVKKKTVVHKPRAPLPPKLTSNQKEIQVEINCQPKLVMNFPPPDMIHEAMAVDNKSEDTRIPTLTKKQMRAVITELSEQRGIGFDADTVKSSHGKPSIDYEADSLERSRINDHAGYSTPSEYAELSSSQPSPSLSAALPMEEEMMMRNAIFNKKTGNMTISKINADILIEDEHDYELIVLKKGSLKKHNFYKLPELLQRNNGYSLVSEVYVNNGYDYSSAPSSASNSNCSTLEKGTHKVKYEEGVAKPGKLLIQVEDCADNYIPVNDSDEFEPDTLDRKPSKIKIQQKPLSIGEGYIDSLERSQQILLRSSGSFKKDIPKPPVNVNNNGNFNRVFGSLREIYEAKTRAMKHMSLTDVSDCGIDEGRILTLEERHSKRQRRLTIGGNMIVPPDVIPPSPHKTNNNSIYEHPRPPRKIIITDNLPLKPPLPPKNGIGRSANKQNTVDNTDEVGTPVAKSTVVFEQGERNEISIPSLMINKFGTGSRQEDSGYLSTDSNDSMKIKKNDKGNSESEESLEDGHSESGAESVETHSVFFGTFRKSTPYLDYGSNDSGVNTVKMISHHYKQRCK